MGSGPSRGKKVAPACAGEAIAARAAAGVALPKGERRPLRPLRIHAILRNARNREQTDRHSAGHDSEVSGEDDEIDAEPGAVPDAEPGAVPDAAPADYAERDGVPAKKHPPRKTFMKPRTYGLCHFGRGDAEDDPGTASRLGASRTPEEPRGSRRASRDVNKRSGDAFTRFRNHTPARPGQHNSSSQGFLTGGEEASPASEEQPTFGRCHGSSLAMPVIMYDGSEEELMDTIEREFS